ncbi:MAG: hypothetical protein ISS82_03585 [Nanoarchaeota archaeon]|nr:hypothetical protein [Nanoarchaeota archaeon]
MGDLDLVSKLTDEERRLEEFSLRCISPDDGKYGKDSRKLARYLSAEAEWMGCADLQKIILETRMDFGKAERKHLDELDSIWHKLSPLNMSLIEKEITKHDQLAVIEEIGIFVSEETKALLHPGTTSYDILDTVRSYLFKKAWEEVIRSEVMTSVKKLCELSEK